MTEPFDPLVLAAEFPPTDAAEWRKLVDAALKGAPFDKRLVSQSYDGLRIEPLYPRAAGAKPVAGRTAAPWQIMARVDHPGPAAANAEALHELQNGATGLAVIFAGAPNSYGYGLAGSEAAVARVFDGVYLEAGVAVELDLSAQHKDAGHILAALIKQRGIAPADTQIRFGYDPIGAKAAAGSSPLPAAEIDKIFGVIVTGLLGQGFKGPFAAPNGRLIHAAGGSEAPELAFALACAVAYLRVFTGAGIKLDDARRMIFFKLAADADLFLTIAKFRSLRKLWARVEEACGLKPERAFVSAETAWRMMTRRDPHVNMLRTTIAVTAAGLGGADAITTLPFTMALGLPERFARRTARNTQLILLEESNLARVMDPAAGSGGIEDLTDKICHSAWALFQEIEAAGGASAALEAGLIQNKVAATRAAHEAAIARRKETLTGTSDYAHLTEAPAAVLDVPCVNVPPLPAAITFPALSSHRLAEPFEKLRDASDRVLAKTGSRPKVFLANLGKLSEFTARASFARNFYEAGGIEAVTSDGFKNRDDMIAAYKKSGAKLACICSSDKIYETEAAGAAKALSAAGATAHLAGRPGDHEAAWQAAGVKTFIFTGCDVLATLNAAHDILGVK